MSRYDKITPPDRPAARGYEVDTSQDDTPTDPYARPLPLRAPTRLGVSRNTETYITRTEFDALRMEVSRIACDQQSIQSVQLADLRTRRKRISDRIRSSVTPERVGKAALAAAILVLPALLERLGYGWLAELLGQLGGEP